MHSWLCHIDDDEYMNVWKLKRMLVKYDPSKPWYIGKSHHEYWKVMNCFILSLLLILFCACS